MVDTSSANRSWILMIVAPSILAAIIAYAALGSAVAPITYSSGAGGQVISSSMAQNKLIGRGASSGTGVFQEITLGTNLALSGTTLNATDTDTGITQLTGDVTAGPGSGSQAATIPNNTVTYAKMQDVSAASKLLGRGDSGSGDPQEITLGTGLSMSGTTISASGSSGTVTNVATGAGLTGGPITTTGTISIDPTANIVSNSYAPTYATTATASGTTTLTAASAQLQYFTGTLTQTVTMPVTSTLTAGRQYEFVNNSLGAITVNSSGGNNIVTVQADQRLILTCILTSGTTAASWSVNINGALGSTGTQQLVYHNGPNLTSPTLTTPILGTPASGDLSNCTNYPIRLRPGGRLSLTSATPVTTSNASGTTVYYTEYFSDLVSIYNGTVWTPTAFSNLSQTLANNTTSPAAAINEACYDYFVWLNAGVMTLSRGPVWSNTATITVTIATPAVVSWTGHGLHEGSPVIFTTSGALPTGITSGTTYYVGRSPAANTFNISTTIANAAAGTFVATSGSQSGTHTGANHTTGSTYITARGTGAGTSELERVAGIWMNKNAITNGPGAQRGVYVGTIYVDAAGNVNDSDSSRGCWNYFNRINSYLKCTDTTDSWNYSTATWRMANGSTTIGTARVEMVFGMNEDSTRVDNMNYGFSSAAGLAVGGGVGLGASNANSAIAYGTIFTNAATTAFSGVYEGQVGVGKWSINRIEIGNAGGTCTWEGDFGATQTQSGMIVRGMR